MGAPMGELDRLEELDRKATAAPWFYTASVQERQTHVLRNRPNGDVLVWGAKNSEEDDPDFLLLVAARNALPALLALARAGSKLAAAVHAADELTRENRKNTVKALAAEMEIAMALKDHDAALSRLGK